MHEKSYRSLIKSITYRITGSLYTAIISYFFTGSVRIALSIGGVEIFTKIFIYYLHERIWDKIKFGKETKSDIEYNI
ncbi:MAG: DUF2061 domain-containing protein [Melioribacter sp.]|uniref:DUF2061 domain-containing protein n=1 Tax=Rosettibacter primus TaxID=3111523 RepID=UPI00247EFE0D|nr:DUF2061 domain-containing protein [Melioribacter sp.]